MGSRRVEGLVHTVFVKKCTRLWRRYDNQPNSKSAGQRNIPYKAVALRHKFTARQRINVIATWSPPQLLLSSLPSFARAHTHTYLIRLLLGRISSNDVRKRNDNFLTNPKPKSRSMFKQLCLHKSLVIFN